MPARVEQLLAHLHRALVVGDHPLQEQAVELGALAAASAAICSGRRHAHRRMLRLASGRRAPAWVIAAPVLPAPVWPRWRSQPRMNAISSRLRRIDAPRGVDDRRGGWSAP